MSSNKRRKMNTDNDLFNILNLDHLMGFEEQRDSNAVIKAILQNPQAISRKYNFTRHAPVSNYYNRNCYPLHQAVWLGTSIDVVKALYNSFPQAIQETCEDYSALGSSFEHRMQDVLEPDTCSWRNKTPTDVILFLISKWPEGVYTTDSNGNTILHDACYSGAPYEVIFLLLSIWPDASKRKDNEGMMPLHSAFFTRGAKMDRESISLLIDLNRDAVKEKDNHKNTPLHLATYNADTPLGTILLLLEKYPDAIIEKNTMEKTPYDVYHQFGDISGEANFELSFYLNQGDMGEKNPSIHQVLSDVHRLYSGEKLGFTQLRKMMTFFIEIEWWNGVPFLLDIDPTFMKESNIHFKVFPKMFSIIGQRCRMKTMWKAIQNELDFMEGV